MDITSIERIHTRKDLIKLLEENRSKECEELIDRLKRQTEISRGSDLKDIFHFLVNID